MWCWRTSEEGGGGTKGLQEEAGDKGGDLPSPTPMAGKTGVSRLRGRGLDLGRVCHSGLRVQI